MDNLTYLFRNISLLYSVDGNISFWTSLHWKWVNVVTCRYETWLLCNIGRLILIIIIIMIDRIYIALFCWSLKDTQNKVWIRIRCGLCGVRGHMLSWRGEFWFDFGMRLLSLSFGCFGGGSSRGLGQQWRKLKFEWYNDDRQPHTSRALYPLGKINIFPSCKSNKQTFLFIWLWFHVNAT